MITVVIPALNEEKTIASMVQTCLKHGAVSEVIVEDDQSSDSTAVLATATGAKYMIGN